MAIMNLVANSLSIKYLKTKFFNDFECFFSYMNKIINLEKHFSHSGYKRHAGTECGILFTLCFYKLLSYGGSVSGFFSELFNSNRLFGQDVFYRFVNNPNIDWRMTHIKLVKRLLRQSSSDQDNPQTFMILDDSLIAKSGRQIEGVSKVHDHTSGRWQLGYKFLGLSILRGNFSTILDFALASEGKKKVKASEPIRTSKRFQELAKDKITLACQLIGRAVSKGIQADYVLFDSWFFCKALANKINNGRQSMHYVGGLKDGKRLFTYKSKNYTLGQLRKHLKNQSGTKRCKSLNSYYLEVTCSLKEVGEVKIFFSRFSGSKKWVMLITSDLSLSYIQTVKIYSKRWNIEVNFKDLKQYMGISKCQSNSFNAQIAHMSTACMLHSMFSLYKSNNYG